MLLHLSHFHLYATPKTVKKKKFKKNLTLEESLIMTEEEKPQRPRSGRGPHNLGDPNDKFLRKTETDILIPKRIRQISREVYCKNYVETFLKCCKENQISFIYTCREQNNEQIKCLEKWFYDEGLRKQVTEEYLEERSEYRRTGIPKKDRDKENSNNKVKTW